MVDRARQFTSIDLRDEKLISLGKLAAGLAHELNNPASAVVRSAKKLTESLGAAEAAARRLGAARLSEAQFAAIDAVRRCAARPRPGRRADVGDGARRSRGRDRRLARRARRERGVRRTARRDRRDARGARHARRERERRCARRVRCNGSSAGLPWCARWRPRSRRRRRASTTSSAR